VSKVELARKAGVSSVTIDRIEKGKPCRLENQRKIVLAIGHKISDKDKIFPRRSGTLIIISRLINF